MEWYQWQEWEKILLTQGDYKWLEINLVKLLILIALLSYSCYKLGQGNPIIVEKTVEVKVYDAGFCASCYKDHSWDEMYVMMNIYQ